MIIKLAIINVSAAMRERLERNKKWLLDELAKIRELHQQLQALEKTFSDAESRRAEFSEAAVTDEAAASKIATAEVQMRHLRPRIDSLRKKLASQYECLGSQIYSVRKDDIRANFMNELLQQLYERLGFEKLLKPYIPPQLSLAATAKELWVSCWQNWFLNGFLSQPAPEINDIAAAESAVQQIVAELDALIGGKTLLEIPPAPEPARPKKVEPKETRPQLTREQIIETAGRAADAAVERV
jgi:hypothetical protein